MRLVGLFLLGVLGSVARLAVAVAVVVVLLCIGLNRAFPHVMVMTEHNCVETPLNMYADQATLVMGTRCWFGIPTVTGLGLSGVLGD